MDHPLYRASMLNNMGVRMLESSNNTLGAIQVLQQAVYVMREFTESTTTTTTTTTPIPTQPSMSPATVVTVVDEPLTPHLIAAQPTAVNGIKSPSRSSITPRVARRDTTTTTTQTTGDEWNLRGNIYSNYNNNEYYYIYDRPFLLPATDMLTAPCILDQHVANVSAIILFNFCLSCHLHGIQFGEATSLRQALRMYELTVRMLQHQQQQDTVSDIEATNNDVFLQVILCLTLNNMASIYYDCLCSYKDGIYCMECVQSLLIHGNNHTTTAVNDDDTTSSIDQVALEFIHEEVWTNIKMNTLFVQIPSVARAA